MAGNVAKSWAAIREWYKIQAVSKELRLAKGASNKDLAALEQSLSLVLPDAVKESYRIHNGSAQGGVFPFGYCLLTLSEIAEEWRRWRDAAASGSFQDMKGSPQGPIKTDWWNSRWVPITASGGGDHDCVDMDPARGGRKGQIIEFSHETGARCVGARGFAEWLSMFASALKAGKYRYDEIREVCFRKMTDHPAALFVPFAPDNRIGPERMSAVFRCEGREPIEVSASWNLAEQIRDISKWLDQPGNAQLARDTILDIGFNSRLGEQIAVQGETIPVAFMHRLVALNVVLWLSIYPPFTDACST